MGGKDQRWNSQELGALGAGLAVTIGVALLTTITNPLSFPWNFAVSFALGGAAFYGVRKVLDPRTLTDVVEQQSQSEIRSMLAELAAIAARIEAGAKSPHVGPKTARRLASISGMIEMIVGRYEKASQDYAGVSSTLLVLQKVDAVVKEYLEAKSQALFLDERQLNEVVQGAEKRVLPMVEEALERLGRKLDLGEATQTRISKDTLEAMLRSLGLIEAIKNQTDPLRRSREAPDDA